MDNNLNIMVVGAGTMGHSIAQVFAMHGFPTTLVDQNRDQLEKAKKLITSNLQTLYAFGAISDQGLIEKTQDYLNYTDDLEAAAPQSNLVVETIYENAEAKRALFSILDQVCPADTILTSNTSALNIFEIAQVSHPERLIIAHWCTPPHIMPLVEIVLGPQTSVQTLETVKNLLILVEKKPVVLNQYAPGFLFNRIGQAIFREASYIVSQGWATAEDVDEAIKSTYGIRWPFEGPLEARDFIGWDVSLRVTSFVIPHLCKDTEPSKLATDLCSKGFFGVKAGRGLKDYSHISIEEAQKLRQTKILKMMKAIKDL
ncbi:MAG: 3-hydroxyacyl-CoA dehydrogenase family protein [Syntrophomonadaceae bacterium]|jgi:3-hydroxybutyryl-CoA dehydrogenase